MIDHRSALILIRNPKCASRSLQEGLCGQEGLQPWLHDGLEQFDHLPPAHYPEKYLSAYSVVVSVRHPVKRAISMWKYAGQSMPFENLEQWAEAGCPCPGAFANEAKRGVDVMDQMQYLTPGAIVIRVEDIEKWFRKAIDLLALPDRDLPHANQSQERATITARAQNALYDRFAEDGNKLGYWKYEP